MLNALRDSLSRGFELQIFGEKMRIFSVYPRFHPDINPHFREMKTFSKDNIGRAVRTG